MTSESWSLCRSWHACAFANKSVGARAMVNQTRVPPKGVPGFPSSQIHTVWLPTTYSQRVSSDGCRQPKIRKLWTPKTKDTARANPKSDPRKRTAVCQRVIPPKITGVPLLQPKLQVGSFFLRLLCVSGRGGRPLSDRVCHRSVVLAEWSAKTQNILAENDILAHGLSFARAPAWIARAVAELFHFPHACLCFSVS